MDDNDLLLSQIIIKIRDTEFSFFKSILVSIHEQIVSHYFFRLSRNDIFVVLQKK